MMISLTLALIAADLHELPTQKLEKGSCATFLWTKTEPPRRIAMIDEKNGTLRIREKKKDRTLSQTGGRTYGDDTITIALDLDIEQNPALTDGALVQAGAMRIDRPDGSSDILAVGGIRGCR